MKKLCILISVGVLVLVSCHIAVAQGYFRTLRQPDGKTFQAVERGDQWLRFYETPEGYIVRRGADGYFRYFNINARGDFIATNLKVGINPPVNVAVRPYENPAVLKALNQKIDAYNTAAEANRQRYLQWQRSMLGSTNSLGKSTSDAYTLSSQSQITLNVGVLLVEFNDVQHHGGASGYTVSDFEDMLFSDDFYHTENNEVESPDDEEVFGSLRDYFQFQSHGILQVDGQVINPSSGGQPTWLNMGNSSQYASGGYYDIKDLVPDAINAAINQSWSVNQDPPFLIAIIIAQDPFAQNVGFEWGYAYFQQDPSPYQNFGFDENEFEASFDYDNWLGAYAMHEREDAEYDDPDDSRFAHIGTHCHEMFHVIGLGLPNVLGQGSEIWHDAGPGDWTLTQTAYRTGPQRKAESPGDLDPIARTRLEWADPTDVDTTLLNEPITYVEEDDDVYETFDFYRFYDPYSDDEFFVENDNTADLMLTCQNGGKAVQKGVYFSGGLKVVPMISVQFGRQITPQVLRAQGYPLDPMGIEAIPFQVL